MYNTPEGFVFVGEMRGDFYYVFKRDDVYDVYVQIYTKPRRFVSSGDVIDVSSITLTSTNLARIRRRGLDQHAYEVFIARLKPYM